MNRSAACGGAIRLQQAHGADGAVTVAEMTSNTLASANRVSLASDHGWTYTGISDHGAADAGSQICEAVMVRYVLIMRHAEYPEILECG